ncbi:MAG TPA: TOMM system kinase/cyclase fusion protein [Kofleriaceae bacterium]|nr:TOMM system kinase/cyclase fusion protein [Kofleriaceae bacterium]
MTDTHDLRAGSVLQGRYKVVSALGAGGFGAVYKAIQLATNQPVAIKVMHPVGNEPESRRENRVLRFRREMDLCARLQHPNIVGLVDSGETDDGRLFAVFQFAAGRSLDQVLLAEGSLHPREARYLMLQVLDALSCAHNLGVVHRDLKPANIMIVSTGTRRNALVLDFGIGAMAQDAHETGYAKLTSQHEWLGTPHYAAPEQIRGNPPNPQSDIYSWGLVYLECLTGSSVISGSPMVAMMIHLGADPIPIPPSLRHHRLGRLLQRAVIKEVSERTATAASLLRELDHCDVSDLEQLVRADDPGVTLTGRHAVVEDLGGPTRAAATPARSTPPPGAPGSITPARPGSGDRSTGRLVDGERRQITAVCCALAPATAVELDELDVLIQVQQDICADVAERFHGQLVGGLGHQVLIEFGYPTAREDDAVRAARAALAIRAAVAERQRDAGGAGRMEIRIGVHTGMIAYGPGETARRISSQVIGMTPMIASQLSALAARDSIMTSAATAKALRAHIVMTPLGTQVLDGVGRGLEMFRIEAERSVMAKGTDEGEAPLPLVGRDREMALLLERWHQVAGGAGQSVLITGEAGIGKSRLAVELSRRIGPNVHTWLEARCTLETRNRVLHPIVEVIERVLELGEVPAGSRLDRIEAALIGFGFRPGDVVPLIAALLSVPQDDRYPAVELSPARRRELTLDVVVSLLIELSERTPVVLFVEDLHWADPTTLELLGALVAAVPSSRVLALFSARPEFAPPWLTSTDRLQLSRLARPQVEQIVGLLTAGKVLPGAVLEQMVNRTDGVPLFVEELTRMVVESGALTPRGDRYELTGALSEVAIPTTLRGSLTARLDRLGRAKETAQIAAALGREFDLALLTAVTALDGAEVQEDLDKLVEADLVHHKRRLRNPTWLFRHALIRDTAYESMPRRVQHKVHARIAEVLEQRFPDVVEARPDLLALHHAAADQKPRAIGYAQKAALAALIAAEYPYAIRHAREAIGWLDAIPDARMRAEMELGFNGIITPSLMSTRGWHDEELKAVIDRSQALSDRLGATQFTGPTLWALALYFHLDGLHRERARTLAERLLAHATSIGDRSQEVMAEAAVGHTRWIDGDYREAGRHFDRALELYAPVEHRGHAYVYGHDSKVWAGISYAEALWFLGQPDRSLALAEESLAWARELNHANSLAIAYIFAILLRHDRGERAAIDELWRPLLALSERHGLPVQVAYAGVVHCWAVGDVDGAKRHLALLETTGTELGLSFYRSVVAEAEAERGELDAALARIDDCRRRAEEVGERYYLAELLRLQGRFLLARDAGAGAEAEALFRRAIEVAAEQGTKMSELRAAIELARLVSGRGDAAGARELIAPRLAWFTEGVETAPLVEARGLLAAP